MLIKNGQFWLGDCLKLMKDIPDGSVNMVITSPPYDNIRTYEGSLNWSFDVFKPIAKELTRCISKGGVIVWNVGDETINGSETGSSFRQALYFKDECNLNLHDTMIWQKSTFSAVCALKVRYAPVFEYMFVFSNGKPNTFNPIKDRKNIHANVEHHGTVRQKNGSTIAVNGKGKKTINEFGQRFNVWKINEEKNSKKHGHPAMFPIQIANDHIISWSNPGDLVLDPFSGSGTTAVAAEQCGRKWICIEQLPEYYYPAIMRVAGL